MVFRTRIKACGITSMADAEAAVAAGVDALGFIFVPGSPRNIDPEKAREIIGRLFPLVDAVGVFMDENAQVVEEIARFCDLTYVQLHGSESPTFCKGIPCRVLKSFSIGGESTESDLAPYRDVVKGVLLDTYHQGMSGGTGKTFDWRLVEKLNPPGPVILAGGLGPENVAEAIRLVRPYGVDVNSGIEREPGVKDGSKLLQFVEEVRKADLRLGKLPPADL